MAEPPRQAGLVAAAAALAGLASAALLARLTLGVPGEWPLNYIRRNRPAVLVEPALLGLLLLGAGWWLLRRAGRPGARRRLLLLAVLPGFLLALHLAMAGPVGVVEPAYRVRYTAGLGSYLVEAEHIGPFAGGAAPAGGAAAPGPAAYIARFHRRLARMPLEASNFRVAVHPPGMTLLVYGLHRFWRGRPAGGLSAARALAGLPWPALEPFLFPRGRTGPPPAPGPLSAKLTALSLLVLGALVTAGTSLLVHRLVLDLVGRPSSAAGAALLWMTVPGVLLHAPALDQLMPALALAACVCWYRACRRDSAAWAAAAGLLIWVGLFFTLAMAVVGAALATATALAVWRGAGRGGALRAMLRRSWPIPVAAAGTFLLLSLGAWLLLDYDAAAVLWQCARRNAEFNAVVGRRSYAGWLLWNPVMFGLFFGPSAVVVWVAGTAASLGGRVRGEVEGGAGALARAAAAAVALTFLLLWVSGQNRGEVERLWSFMMALALAAGAAGLACRAPPAARTWLALLALQLLLLFVLRYRADVQNVVANLEEDLHSRGAVSVSVPADEGARPAGAFPPAARR